MRGEVHRLHAPHGTRGHEQSGARYAVVVQSDSLPLSTWLVAPTSTSARAATFRPDVHIEGQPTRVLAEQTTAIDPERLRNLAGTLTHAELAQVDAALRLVLSLWTSGAVGAPDEGCPPQFGESTAVACGGGDRRRNSAATRLDCVDKGWLPHLVLGYE